MFKLKLKMKNELPARTNDGLSTKADVTTSCPNSGKPDVVRSFYPLEPLIQDGDFINFLIEFEKGDDETSVNFNVFEVTSWNADDNKPIDNELYLKGYIKWDGCSHIWFGDGDGYLHLCGKHYFDQHKKVIDAIWDMSSKRIKRFDNDVAS